MCKNAGDGTAAHHEPPPSGQRGAKCLQPLAGVAFPDRTRYERRMLAGAPPRLRSSQLGRFYVSVPGYPTRSCRSSRSQRHPSICPCRRLLNAPTTFWSACPSVASRAPTPAHCRPIPLRVARRPEFRRRIAAAIELLLTLRWRWATSGDARNKRWTRRPRPHFARSCRVLGCSSGRHASQSSHRWWRPRPHGAGRADAPAAPQLLRRRPGAWLGRQRHARRQCRSSVGHSRRPRRRRRLRVPCGAQPAPTPAAPVARPCRGMNASESARRPARCPRSRPRWFRRSPDRAGRQGTAPHRPLGGRLRSEAHPPPTRPGSGGPNVSRSLSPSAPPRPRATSSPRRARAAHPHQAWTPSPTQRGLLHPSPARASSSDSRYRSHGVRGALPRSRMGASFCSPDRRLPRPA